MSCPLWKMLILTVGLTILGAVHGKTTSKYASNQTVSAETTFYGARDNCPPGGDIAYPQIHNEAGGNGTYNNPITYAGAKKATEPGTIIYVEFLQKYFIMEDDCEECDNDWKSMYT